jgi:hypothetical protein
MHDAQTIYIQTVTICDTGKHTNVHIQARKAYGREEV